MSATIKSSKPASTKAPVAKKAPVNASSSANNSSSSAATLTAKNVVTSNKAPVDKADISKAESAPVRNSVSSLLSSLEDDYSPSTDDASETNEASGEEASEAGAAEQPANPYEGFADRSVSVKAEAWTSDRTPGEGQVSRNDHIEGMLRNQGYEVGDIYGKDENGLSLLDRVAQANGLSDPNQISPDQELVLPTRHENNEAEATAETNSDNSPATAEANAETNLDQVVDQESTTTATANATTTGANSDATAAANADVNVGHAENAQVAAVADATATAKGPDSDATATADANLTVGTAVNSQLSTDASANAAAADGVAVATATSHLEAQEVTDTEFQTSTEATVTRPQAPAAPTQPAAPAPYTVRTTTEGYAEDATGVEIDETVKAEEEGATAEQDLTVAENNGEAAFIQETDAVPDGTSADGTGTESTQNADFAGQGDMAIAQRTDAEVADQNATNHEVESDPFMGTRFDDSDTNFTEQTATEGDFASQAAQGIRNVRQIADGREHSIMGSDAQNARYEGADNGDMKVTHTGINGTVAVEMEADKVYFSDGEDMGPRMHTPTRNRVAGDIVSDDVRMRMEKSESFNGRIQGTDENSRHELHLPNPQFDENGQQATRTGNENNVVIDTGAGEDFVGVQGGAGNLLIEKSEGDLRLNINPERAQSSEVLIDAGDSNMTGTVDLRDIDQAMVQVRGGSADSDVRFRGGSGADDTMVIHLEGDQEINRGLNIEGFENLIYVRDGQVVDGAGFGNQEYKPFDDSANALEERAAQG